MTNVEDLVHEAHMGISINVRIVSELGRINLVHGLFDKIHER